MAHGKWLLLITTIRAHAPKAANISQTPYRRKAAVFASLEDGTAVLFSGKTKDERVNNGHMAYVGDTWLFQSNALPFSSSSRSLSGVCPNKSNS